MNSDIRFNVIEDNPAIKGIPLGMLFYGQLCGPVISGEFQGSQMIRVLECPEWAPFKYDKQFVGRLIPTALVSHGFDFPVHDSLGGVRKFLLYAECFVSIESEGGANELIASADEYADILEHAYAHARYIKDERRYQIVNHATMKGISHCYFYPDNAADSWVWGASK